MTGVEFDVVAICRIDVEGMPDVMIQSDVSDTTLAELYLPGNEGIFGLRNRNTSKVKKRMGSAR
jgi:hypothetical protein